MPTSIKLQKDTESTKISRDHKERVVAKNANRTIGKTLPQRRQMDGKEVGALTFAALQLRVLRGLRVKLSFYFFSEALAFGSIKPFV